MNEIKIQSMQRKNGSLDHNSNLTEKAEMRLAKLAVRCSAAPFLEC